MLSGRYGCKEPLLEDQNEAETKHAILRSILKLKTEITQPRHERRHNLLNRNGPDSWSTLWTITYGPYVMGLIDTFMNQKSLARKALKSQVVDIPNRIYEKKPASKKVNFIG